MREFRGLHSESFEDEQMLEGVCQVILAADDVADPQVRIVCARCHMVRRHAVASQQSEIFDVYQPLGLRIEDEVVKEHASAGIARNSKTEDKRLTGSRP